jgi:5'-3' exonuclease
MTAAAKLQLVLDSPSLFYRAFFALPPSLRDDDGQSVNAVRGYLDMTTVLLTEHRPARIVHVMDADWRPAWRVDAYPGYKADRPDDPPELAGQPELITEVLTAAGMPVAEAEGYEADDVIGTLAARAGRSDRLAVVTGDRDLFQVVRDPSVVVLFPVKGVSDVKRFDEAAVREAHGVPASRYADYAILRGDPSDGLPGLRGVGPKTAAKLIGEYDDLDALVAAAPKLKGRLAETVGGAAEYLATMRTVVPVVTDVKVTETPAGKPDRDRLHELAGRHAIESPVRRLLAALDDLG